MKTIPGLIIVMSILVLLGCQLDTSPGENVEIRISEDIILRMAPSLHPSGQDLNFIFESTNDYTCNEAGFEYQSKTSGQNVEIQLFNVDVPEPCLGGFAPARETVSMPRQSGTFFLTISIGSVIENRGKLTIDPAGYRLELESSDGIFIPFTTMLRLPKGTIWGYVYNLQQPHTILTDLQTLLAPHISEVNLEGGNYGLFQADDSQKITMDIPANRSTAIPFVFEYKGIPSALDNLFHEVIQELPPGTEVKVFGWNGFVF